MSDASRIRLAAINLLVLSLLATLVARLWFLQVLAQEEAQRQVEQTSIRLIYQDAPRGFMYDRNGEVLARNRTALTVAVDMSRLPEGSRDVVLPKLASVLGLSEKDVRKELLDPRHDRFTPIPVALDVAKDTVIYLLEHQTEFPGVVALEIPVREYPNGTLAAHVIGHIGKISAAEYKDRTGYRRSDNIGKIGIERAYERYLKGQPGIQKISVNSRGEKVEDFRNEPPDRGWDAFLTLDSKLQRAAEDALQRGIDLARRLVDRDTGEYFTAPAGAVVALDPQSGEVLALASNPTFDPNIFVGPAPTGIIAGLNAPESNKPMFNRAVAEAVPPGSTFKPITAAAAWDAAAVSPGRTFGCPGFLKVGNRTFKDWTPSGHGTVGLRKSLVESCDVVYYTLGIELNSAKDRIGEHLQAVARTFGFGRSSGIDILGEQAGLVPDAAWKEARFSHARPYDRRWFPGDSANLAVGQGFLQVTPLQLASAYGSIANGGTLYRPHLMKCLAQINVSQTASAGEACRGGTLADAETGDCPVQEESTPPCVPEPAAPKVTGRVPVAPGALDFIAQSMSGVGLADGTAAAAFSGFPFHAVPVAGKTGTAQMKPRQPFSWFAAFAPVQDPKIVVVALVEEAGTGAQVAAPIVRRVMEAHFGIPEGNFEAGARAD